MTTTAATWGGVTPRAHKSTRPRIPHARKDRMPDLRPSAGHYLLAGVNAVLAHLADPAPATHPLADELRTALARTAACGDTCRVRPAADAVRAAMNLLLAGSAEQANQILVRVQAELARR
ncbi:MAG: hypothetical protein ACJ72N_26430 [Labedaea sp.]